MIPGLMIWTRSWRLWRILSKQTPNLPTIEEKDAFMRCCWRLFGFAAIIAMACRGQTPGAFPPTNTGGLTVAHFASLPSAPRLNQAFLFVDAVSSGTCGGGGTAYAVCAWNGSAFSATGGTSTGLGDPGANGIVYRSGAGTSTIATATQMSGANFCQDAGSSGTTYTCNLSPVIGSYATGTLYWFKANTTNTGSATINFNSKGPLTIKKMVGGIATNLAANDIASGQWVAVIYD